jgi:hypothetical protein
VSVVASLMSDLVMGWAIAQKRGSDQAVNSAFSLEPLNREADLESPVLYFDSLQDLVRLGIADLPMICPTAPRRGSLKRYTRGLSIGITNLQVLDN